MWARQDEKIGELIPRIVLISIIFVRRILLLRIFSSRAISLCEYFHCPSVVFEVWIIAFVGLA
jgi:hypothetical protein